MFRFFIFLLIVLVKITHQNEKDEKTCLCRKGYQVSKNVAGDGLECLGYGSRHICNEPQKPRCSCDNKLATGVLVNKEGSWCYSYKPEASKPKWPCENVEEWEEYHKKYEEVMNSNE